MYGISTMRANPPVFVLKSPPGYGINETSSHRSPPMKKWKCTVCGYVHQGDEPPATCPICGALREKFVQIG